LERYIGARRPAFESRTPDIGGPDSGPLDLPELLEKIHCKPGVDFVEIVHAESVSQAPGKLSMTDIPPGTQLVPKPLNPDRCIEIYFGS
jgi:hypothetical protein